MVVAGQPDGVTKECLPHTDYAWTLMKREVGAIMQDLYSPRFIYGYRKGLRHSSTQSGELAVSCLH
jgi:hypothetical protein